MKKNISIIGGDLRTVKLANLLQKDGFIISSFGLESSEEIDENKKTKNIEECIQNSEIIISAIPVSRDGININSPYSKQKIEIRNLLKLLKKEQVIFLGNISKEIIENTECKVIDLLEDESLIIMNAIPSAEGGIQLAMEKSQTTIHSSKILVMGFGRIGKILAKMLQGLGAEVYCEARKDKDISWIQAYGYNPVHLKDLEKELHKFDIIFNTIPYMILDKNKLQKLKKNCIIIDLASKPGGVDFEQARQMGISTEWALGLPGKVAPETAAKYIKEAIIKQIKFIKII